MRNDVAIVAVLVALGSGPAVAQSLSQTPSVHFEVTSAKSAQTLAFTGIGFVPNETVDVVPPLVQVTADAEGRLSMATALTPLNLSGDNRLIFVGQQSQAELSATFTVATQ